MRNKVRLKQYALGTEDAYGSWTGRYYDYCRQLDKAMTHEEKAEAFLTHLAVDRQLSARSQNQALAALLFLYKEVLGKPLGDVDGIRAKKPKRERSSPSKDQIRAFRAAVVDTGAHTRSFTCRPPLRLRAPGVRAPGTSRERCSLERATANDPRSQGLQGPEGAGPRRLPRATQGAGREGAHGLGAGSGRHPEGRGLSPPPQLRKKYPYAPFAWQWFWIFPAPGHCNDPRTGERVRYRLLEDSLQRAVHEASAQGRL